MPHVVEIKTFAYCAICCWSMKGSVNDEECMDKAVSGGADYDTPIIVS